MDWKIALLLFFSNILDDILCVLYTRRIVAGKSIQAAVLTGFLTVIVAFSVINYVENKWYLIPTVCGSMIGTFYAIKIDKYLKKKKRKKKKVEKKSEVKNETAGMVGRSDLRPPPSLDR